MRPCLYARPAFEYLVTSTNQPVIDCKAGRHHDITQVFCGTTWHGLEFTFLGYAYLIPPHSLYASFNPH